MSCARGKRRLIKSTGGGRKEKFLACRNCGWIFFTIKERIFFGGEKIPPAQEMFNLLKTSSASMARRGRLETVHGLIETPVFMPVGTQATVKALTPDQIEETGAQIILSNTYHLNLRPTSELIEKLGGLHKFMRWQKPILTDSGGFQAFSLAGLRKIGEQAIEFRSHLDGAKKVLSPESCMEIQCRLGSDIAMVLDECIEYPAPKERVQSSVDRTLRWAERCLEHSRKIGMPERGLKVFGIVQGGCHEDIRRYCSERIAQMDFDGCAIGGVSVGEPEEEMLMQVASCTPYLPADKPRYVMGVGTPQQLLKMISLGADMFDCVMPTRLARHANAFTTRGIINLKNAKYAMDEGPIDRELENYASKFSRAYIRHLIMAQESLAATLLSIHNIHFFQTLMKQAREHIESGDFEPWRDAWLERYNSLEG